MSRLTLLLEDQRGTVLVKCSSLVLLIAIAALIVLGQTDGHFSN